MLDRRRFIKGMVSALALVSIPLEVVATVIDPGPVLLSFERTTIEAKRRYLSAGWTIETPEDIFLSI